MVLPSAYCEACNVKCHNVNNLSIHKAGQKHKKNLNKLKVRASAGLISVGTREHMEVKKRRLLENGEPKKEVRFCEACSIFVNTQIV